MRILVCILGIVIAAVGGVIAYRAYFLEPTSTIVITETEVRELPDTLRIVAGLALLAIGAIVAFLSLHRRNRN